MKDGSRTGLGGGEGNDVCVGGLGYSPSGKCGEPIFDGEVEGSDTEYTFCRLGESDS